MNYLIVTDKIDSFVPIADNVWGSGTRLYYCGETPEKTPNLAFAIGSATRFETFEAAEIRLLLLCIWETDLIEHARVMPEDEAWAQWQEDLKEFEKKSGIEDSLGSQNRGCF